MRSTLLLVALGVISAPLPVRAQSAEQCVSDHAAAQDLRKNGKLLGARARFISCSADACPAMVRRECEKLLDDVDASVPSIIVRAVGPDGTDTTDVTVSADGEVVAQHLGTTQLQLDPGERKLRFEHASGAVVERKLVLVEGEKSRVVELDFRKKQAARASAPAHAVAPASHGPPALVWVLGGVSVAALGSFTYFGLDGRSKQSDLDSCKPNCTNAAYDKMARSYLIADISLAAAVLAGGAAVWIGLGSSREHESSFALGATPLPRGGSLGVRSNF